MQALHHTLQPALQQQPDLHTALRGRSQRQPDGPLRVEVGRDDVDRRARPADEVAPDEATLDQALTAELADRSVSEAAARVAASLAQVHRASLRSGQKGFRRFPCADRHARQGRVALPEGAPSARRPRLSAGRRRVRLSGNCRVG